jgi:D-lactate dehydrogenase
MGLLLTISHNLQDALLRTERGDFSREGLRGFDLEDKVLGVIGTGAIGRRVIEMAKGFRMQVVAYDVVQDETLAEELGFRYTDLPDLLGVADVVTLHVPANEQTHHLLDEAEFRQMKAGAVLLNTARGEIVNTEALVQALSKGRVSAVGLDVLPEEPVIREEAELLRTLHRREHDLENLLADHVLMRLKNVFITPHSAFYTREAVERILDTTVENIRAFIVGEVRNVVTDGNRETG